ncbi:MAG: Ig-like domain-containing protein, partial [Taibaiella sp.]|nr:Ig-like domain-containing protein [Taibaiella sp.]
MKKLDATHILSNRILLLTTVFIFLFSNNPVIAQSAKQAAIPTNNLWEKVGSVDIPEATQKNDKGIPITNAGGKTKKNFTDFSKTTRYEGKEVINYNSGFEQHPELGVLYADVPCNDCYELIGKRTATQKYFVKEGTQTSSFVLQSHQYPVHYKDASGNWLTITGNLEKDEKKTGVYFTKGRPVNAEINTKNRYSKLAGNGISITYNNKTELVYVKSDGTETSLGQADWSNYTAGDDGIRITDAWPGIDIEITVLANSLKTNFVVKNALPAYASGKLILRDNIITSEGLSMDIHEAQIRNGSIDIVNSSGDKAFTINNAFAYELNGNENSITELTYKKTEDNTLDIEIPGSLLNKTATSYPLIIDPLVASTLSSGFTYTSGTFPPAFTSTSEYCTNTNNISIPAAATLTNIEITYNYYGPPSISWAQSRLAFQINGACTYGWLSCAATALSSGIPGNTCGLMNSSFWSTGPAWGTTSGCLPAFNCNAYSLPFQLLLTQAQTSTAACAQTVYATASGFTVTLSGTTAMLPTITPSTAATVCMPTTLALTGSPAGTWSSSVPAVGTVSTTGIVTGITNGTTNITYTASGCTSFINVTVGTTPTVTGTPSICFPGSTTLTGTPGGGTWTSSLTGVATVAAGVVTGVSVGTTIINYNTGTCSFNQPVDVNNPAAVTPTTQPTSITFSSPTPTGATINFTPNGSTGYLVVASTNSVLYASPTTYTTYATGASFGGGIVIQGSTSGSSPSYTTTLLNSNTYYYVFVFAFNNNCTGPQYNSVSPLTGGFSTCVAPTSTPTIGTTGVNFISLSWTASPAGGSYINPINYTVYAYTDAALTTLATGFPAAAGVGTTYTATGLTPATQYWFRVSPSDACAIVSGVATGMTVCTSAGSIPYLQTFEVSTTLGDRNPNCMTSNVQNCVFSGVQTSVTFTGVINTNHTPGGTKFYNFYRGGACSSGWANQWLLLPGLAMTAGTTYTLSFWYRTDGTAWPSITAHYSTTSTVPAVTATVMGGSPGTIGTGVTGTATTTYLQYIQNFTVPTSGTYYIGLNASSAVGAGTSGGLLAIDDIEVCAVPTVTATNSTAPYCAPDTVYLTSTGTTSAVTYAWAGPAGYTSTSANPPGLTGLGAGSYTYTLTAVNDPISAGYGGYCTASVTTTFTMNNPPAAITGATSLCTGQTTTLANSVSGGTWSSSNPAVGTISTSGVLGGITGGTTTITYSIGGCFATMVVTVTPMPGAIGGITIACLGGTTVLSNSVSGGTWFCSSTCTNLTVGATTGIVTGVALGTCIVTYSTGGSCFVTTTVTVNPLPAPITGSASVCIGTTTPYTSATPGGVWTSSTPSVASVHPITGIVTGVSVGTATISYRVAGCSVTQVITVIAAPTPIVGPSTVCVTFPTITLTNISAGGTWSSSNTNVTIGSATGVVTGNVAGGTSTITYSLSAGCYATTVVTVLPTPAAITGTLAICESGGTTTLSHPISGGTWASGSSNVTVALGTGLVTGVTAGTANVTYTLPTGCVAIAVVTVNALPAPITGILSICVGGASTLSSATPGVTWSSSSPSIATIGIATGIVTGISPGTVTMICPTTAGCQRSVIVTVNPAPSSITGILTVCTGQTTTLSSATSGGAWSSSTPAVGTVSGTGVVTGLTAGTTIITYGLGSGCFTTATVTVNSSPAPITGTLVICTGFTTTLSSATTGGVWSSSTPSVAPILSPGIVAGAGFGTSTIVYTLGSCSATAVVTVIALPTIGGGTSVCVGQCSLLTSPTTGGTWSSSSAAIGTVDPSTGLFCGISPGTATISYSTGCVSTTTVTVNANPSAIGGTLSICAGISTTLSSAPGGGTWVSSDGTVATIGVGTGTAIGIAPGGTATISYTLATGCRSTAILTVNTSPAVITGVTNVCIGATTTLSSATMGGIWSSSNGNSTVNPVTGVVTGVFAGTSTISYTLPTGCSRTAVVLINPLPTGISGSLQVCEGSATTLSGTPAGGTWVSSTPAIGTIGIGTGTLGGILAGTTTITYTLPTTCQLTAIASVNPLPAAITGTPTTCIGQTTSLSSTSAGGTWASGSPLIGTIDAAGTITGLAAGTSVISYTLPTGCRRTIIATVYALPTLITGAANVCVGLTTTLNSTPAGGTWTSSAPLIAPVALTTGVVTGNATGTATITYTVGTGCFRTTTVTVNALPNPITGSLTTCVSGTTTLSSTTPGGIWSSGATGVATIGATTGIVNGLSGTSTATISYTLPTTCRVTDVVTVYALPANITGSLQVCVGSTASLSTATPGGTWASSTPAVGSIDATSGVATGIAAGTTTITYTLGTGCIKTAVLTVNSLPASIGGVLQVCQGATTTLTNATGGGTWSSSTPANASISAGGIVTGVLPGTSTISYTLATGCRSTAIVTVNGLPGVISGPSEVCVNSTINLGGSPGGGIWSSPHATVAVNPATGDVTGVTAGTATISYTIGTGCVRTTIVSVNPLPSPITGNPGVCIGSTTTLATLSTGGTWISISTGIATIDASGVVTSVAVGTTTISYVLPVTGCASTVIVTVNSLPATITGSDGFCNLSSTTYSTLTPGVRWSTSDPSVIVIDSVTGVATGVSVDTADIIVRVVATGCTVSKSVFLILAPYPITGPNDVCLTQCITLGNLIGGGTWSSSNSTVAPISSTGTVCGAGLGVATITYVLSTGCSSVHSMTVNPIPVGILGSLQVCEGLTTALTNITPGGNWTSSDISIATIGSSSGIVTGISGGTAIITYALGTGCNSTVIVTVNPLPGAITGTPQVCEGLSTTLATTSTGGLWSSADPGIADINAVTGHMTGMSAMTTGAYGTGITTITYTLPTGCIRTLQVSVNPLPAAISGAMNICVGDATAFTNTTPGGGWMSSNPAVGTIDGVTGVFSGISAGVSIISYVLPTSCIATKSITVNANPAAIGGSLSVCAGFSTNLTSGPAGGAWSQDPMSMTFGTIHTMTGVVSGITAGTIPVTYTLGSGCRVTETVTVITLPSAISGTPRVCVGDSTIMTNPVAGGTWSSSNTARATMDAITGMVHGISAGTAVITYAVGTGCFNVHTITVNALPATIVGPLQVCEGSTILLSNATPGGLWISDTTAHATIGFVSGIVTGISAGLSNISYSIATTGCLRRVQVTVNQTPPAITGNPHICIGAANTFSNTMPGGSWYSSNPAIATIGLTTGIATSVTTGIITISYVMPATGCMATRIVTVQPLPTVYNVTGGGNYCAGGFGNHIYLSGSQPGVSYALYRGATATGYLPGTGFALDFGLLTGAGVYTVQATNVTSGCMRNMAGSATITITPLVTPTVAIIATPDDSVCAGQSVTLTADTAHAGNAPTYLWKVNGVSVGAAINYAFVPANGDVATVAMTSNANCLAASTASASKTLT